MTKQTICFVAGKSGGHIIPCLTLAQRYKDTCNDLSVLFFSTNTPLDKIILSHTNLITWHIPLPLSSIQANTILQHIHVLLNAARSVLLSFVHLYKHKPSCIISTGGIVALPVCLAGLILRIPIILYCLDAVPGKAIKTLSPFASSIFVAFNHARQFFPAQRCSVKAYPIKYVEKEKNIITTDAHKNIGLDFNKKTILVLGGSQGSVFLNDCIKKLIKDPSFSSQTLQIIHQTGSIDQTDWKQLYQDNNITAHIFSYTQNLSSFYVLADIIICRAGAGTLFEIEFFKKKCIIIPLITNTTSHQIDNARAITNQYPDLFCWIHQQKVEKNPEVFFSLLTRMLTH